MQRLPVDCFRSGRHDTDRYLRGGVASKPPPGDSVPGGM